MNYLLAIGSNHRRARSLRLAAQHLSASFNIIDVAGPEKTLDAGTCARYLNAAAIVRTDASPELVRARLKAIEREAGREHGASRCTLDIDLVARLEGKVVIEVFKPADLHAAYLQRSLDKLHIHAPLLE